MAEENEKIDCESVLKHLFEHLDRELDPAHAAAIDRHLAGCRGCFTRAEFERRLLDLMRAQSAEAPHALRDRIARVVEDF